MKLEKINYSEIGFIFEFAQRVSFLEKLFKMNTFQKNKYTKDILHDINKIISFLRKENAILYIFYSFFKNDSKFFINRIFKELNLNNSRINFFYFDNVLASNLLQFYNIQSDINEMFKYFLDDYFHININNFISHKRQGQVANADFLIDFYSLKRVGKFKKPVKRNLYVMDFSEYVYFAEYIANTISEQYKGVKIDFQKDGIHTFLKIKDKIGFLLLLNKTFGTLKKINNESLFFDIETKTKYDIDYLIDKIYNTEYRNNVYFLLKQFNKNIAKIIQAGSYAYYYIQNFKFNFDKVILASKSSISYDVVSFKNKEENLNTLKKCYTIYSNSKSAQDNVNVIFELLEKQFEGNIFDFNFLKKLYDEVYVPFYTKPEILAKDKIIKFTIKQGEFIPLNDDFRIKHSEAIKKVIKEGYKTIFLTANPGAGKTYTPLRLNKNPESMFFYFSSRTAINESLKNEIINELPNELNINTITFSVTNDILNLKDGSKKIHYIKTDISDKLKEKEIINFLNSEINKNSKTNFFIFATSEEIDKKFLKKEIRKNSYIHKNIFNNESKELNEVIRNSVSVYETLNKVINFLQNIKENSVLKNYKCFILGTLQGYENNVNKYLDMFIRILKGNNILMLDELMGTSHNFKIVKTVLNKINELRTQTGILIFADANLKNKDSIELLLNEKDNSNKILVVDNDLKKDGVLVKKFIYNNKTYPVVEASAFPAKNINISFELMLRKTLKSAKIYKSTINKELINKIINISKANLKENEKTFVYIQDKNFIEQLRVSINNKDKNIRILILTQDTSKNKITSEKIKNKDYDVILATSSASRGLSFKDVRKFIIIFQNFNIVNGLNELSQVIYRGRGVEKDENGNVILNNDDANDKDFIILFKEIEDNNSFFATGNENRDRYFVNKKFIEMVNKILFTANIFYIFSNYKKVSNFFIPVPASLNTYKFNSYFQFITELEKIQEKLIIAGFYNKQCKTELDDFIYYLNALLKIFNNYIDKVKINFEELENDEWYMNGFVIRKGVQNFQEIYINDKNKYSVMFLVNNLENEFYKHKKILSKIDKSIPSKIKTIKEFFEGINSKRIPENTPVLILSEAFLTKEVLEANSENEKIFESIEVDLDVLKELDEEYKSETLAVFSESYIKMISSLFLIKKNNIYTDFLKGIKGKDTVNNKPLFKSSITVFPEVKINDNKTYNVMSAILSLYI